MKKLMLCQVQKSKSLNLHYHHSMVYHLRLFRCFLFLSSRERICWMSLFFAVERKTVNVCHIVFPVVVVICCKACLKCFFSEVFSEFHVCLPGLNATQKQSDTEDFIRS